MYKTMNIDTLCMIAQWPHMAHFGIHAEMKTHLVVTTHSPQQQEVVHNEILSFAKSTMPLLHITFSRYATADTLTKLVGHPKASPKIRAWVALHPNCDGTLKAKLLSDKRVRKCFADILRVELESGTAHPDWLAHIKSQRV